jgi:hypothetical protein
MRLVLFALVVAALQPRPSTGTIRFTFTERGRLDVTAVEATIYYESAATGRRERLVRALSQPYDLTSLPAGEYRLTVVAQTMTAALVASEAYVVEVVGGGRTPIAVNLIERRGWITVRDSEGAPVPSAHFYSRPSAVNSTADAQGRINLALLAPGTEVSVRTIQWGVTCRRVTMATAQTLVVPDATEESVILAPTVPVSGLPQRRQIVPSLRLAGAELHGIPGANCPVPYEHLPVTLARRGPDTTHTLLLPFGDYTLRLRDGTTVSLSAPGSIRLDR